MAPVCQAMLTGMSKPPQKFEESSTHAHTQSVHTARTGLQVRAARTGIGGRLAGSDGGGMAAACVLVFLLVAAAEATKDRHEGGCAYGTRCVLRGGAGVTAVGLRKSAEESPGIDPAPTLHHTQTSHTHDDGIQCVSDRVLK